MPYQDDPGVFRIRAMGGERERVVDLKGFQFTGVYGFDMELIQPTHRCYFATLEATISTPLLWNRNELPWQCGLASKPKSGDGNS